MKLAQVPAGGINHGTTFVLWPLGVPASVLVILCGCAGSSIKSCIRGGCRRRQGRCQPEPHEWLAPSAGEWGSGVHSAWRDSPITAGVTARLAREKVATLVKVNVDTNQGVVQLNGSVDREHSKQRAAELARQVDGVREVVNTLKAQD